MPSTERTPRPADPDYARIKALFDPQGLLNPGVML